MKARRGSAVARIGVAVLASLGLWLIVNAVVSAWRNVAEIDFHVFYASSVAWRNGQDLYAAIPGALPNLNPPQFIVLFAPLTWVNEQSAIALWLALNLAALFLAGCIIWRELRLPLSFTPLMLAFAAAGLNIGLVFGLEEGHPVGLFTLCVTAAWAAARQKRWKAAAVLVGALVGIKPFFSCLLLMWVCRRQWNAIGWALATAAASLLAGIALGGTAGFLRWLDTGRHVSWFHHPLNASIAGLAARAGVSWQLWALMTLFVVFVTVLVLRKTKDLDAEWLACGLVSLLASPLGWAYYVPLVAGPLGAVAIRRRIMLPAAAGFVWPIPLAMALVPTTTAWTRITIISLTSWSLIAMWSIVVNMLSRGERPWPLRFSTPRPSLPDATPAHR